MFYTSFESDVNNNNTRGLSIPGHNTSINHLFYKAIC